jgi:hypothetical protein
VLVGHRVFVVLSWMLLLLGRGNPVVVKSRDMCGTQCSDGTIDNYVPFAMVLTGTQNLLV